MRTCCILVSVIVGIASADTPGSAPREFSVKREAVFKFVRKPAVTREGDRVTIAFESKGLCDATVAIEDGQGRIIRHLACGVLGPNAPAPFQENSSKQTLVWDGKSDQGEYVDDKDSCTVRVSLGLKPRFERSLLWEPKRRISPRPALMVARPEGVYVYEGVGGDHLRLFDHNGNYVRTVYPFAARALKQVDGLDWQKFPQLADPQPLKRNAYKNTLLTSGRTGRHCAEDSSKVGVLLDAASAMAVSADRLALANQRLNYLPLAAVSRPTDRIPLNGPETAVKHGKLHAAPGDIAFSPDGRRLYLTGYHSIPDKSDEDAMVQRWVSYRPVVRVMDVGRNDPPRAFGGTGGAKSSVKMPTSVACDAKGNVYVADHEGNCIHVFNRDGQPVKKIAVHRPMTVRVHPVRGDIYVFSFLSQQRVTGATWRTVHPRLFHFGPLEKPDLRHRYDIQGVPERLHYSGWYSGCGIMTRAEIDIYADPPVVWTSTELQKGKWGAGAHSGWERGIRLMTMDNGKLKLKRSFGADAARTLPTQIPATKASRYLLVTPRNGKLLVADARGADPRSMPDLIEVDPESGKSRLVKVPFKGVQDLAFDYDGRAYGRVGDVIVRFDFATGREIPWDYGEEREFHNGSIRSGLPMGRDNWWTLQNGIGLAPDGSIAALSLRWAPLKKFRGEKSIHESAAWLPQIYPGRPDGHVLTVWDRHGKVVSRDAIPGTPMTSGIGLDARRDLVVMANVARSLPGKTPGFRTTCTLMKVTPGQCRFLTDSGKAALPLPAEHRPNRPRDVASGWVEGAHWLYGGVGYDVAGSIHCMCWHSRFTMDGFGRSFAPEPDIYRVAVLDTNGNLILRVGQYGNVDDGTPMIRDGGPADSRPLGKDEVALFNPHYVGVQTDRRLFIADAGNDRIVSVKLSYHAEEKVAIGAVGGAEGGKMTKGV